MPQLRIQHQGLRIRKKPKVLKKHQFQPRDQDIARRAKVIKKRIIDQLQILKQEGEVHCIHTKESSKEKRGSGTVEGGEGQRGKSVKRRGNISLDISTSPDSCTAM